MSDIAGIAGNAVAVYQQALSTVSNNIANVSTEGYSRQDVALSALPVTKAGSVFLGSGVGMDRVKRQYDQFVESNLRNTTSDLAAQGPVVDYANRIVDVMGSQSMGLNTAFDAFFSTARNLSADPSSTVLRSSFVRDASMVTDRFGQLSAQLDLVQDETQQQLDASVVQINALTSQIAKVNGQLSKQSSEAAQPPDLLDQRDLLLKQLSEFLHVNTRFEVNGQVTVSVGPTITQDLVVSNQQAFNIGTNFNSASTEKAALVLDPYGKPQSLTGITSGSLAGLLTFREQVLGSTRNSLDNLAQVFANEVNTIHRQGIDGYGHPGQDILKFDSSAATPAGGIRVAFSDPMLVAAASQFRVIEAPNNPSGTDATLHFNEPLNGPNSTPPPGPAALQDVFTNNNNTNAAKPISVSATLPITAVATVQQGMSDVSIYLDMMQPGQHLEVLTRDGRQLIGAPLNDPVLRSDTLSTLNGFAAGAQYSDQYLNQSGAAGYKGMSVFYGAKANAQVQPVYNPDGSISADKTTNFPAVLQGDRINPMTASSLPAPTIGTGSTVIAANGGIQIANTLQIAAGDLNLNGSPRKLFIGGAEVVIGANVTDVASLATAINNTLTANVQASVAANGNLVLATKGIPAGSYTLNGVSLGELDFPANGSNLQPSAIAAWVNAKSGLTGVSASAINTIAVDTSKIRFGLPLYINGQAVDTSAALTLKDLAAAINDANTGVSARVDPRAGISLSNTDGSEITVASNTVPGSTAQNALGLSTGTYRGSLSLTQPVTDAAKIAVSALKFDAPLCINGVQIGDASAVLNPVPNIASLSADQKAQTYLNLVNAINAKTPQSNVQARLSKDGSQIILSNVPGSQGGTIAVSRTPLQQDIVAGSYIAQGPNALGLNNGEIPKPEESNLNPLELGFGTGTPAELLKMGFRSGAFITGPVKDDLLIFVSGPGTAMVSASYSGKPTDRREELRANPMTITFTSDTHYKIVDNKTGTVVAERDLDPLKLNPAIQYQGLSLSFTAAPKATDVFLLDGNTDGVGNNDNMLAISGLETKSVVGKKTISNAYIDQINEMGNIARQATISKTALTVVHDQAVKSRDTVSGVSLDKEAADLIRYQQAYQASAKTLQIAGQLFDTVLHVN